MARSHITGTTATQVAGPSRKALIQVNATLTGNIKVIDGTSGSTANVATITDPTVGSQYEYWHFTEGVRVIASASCDITVSTDGSQGPL